MDKHLIISSRGGKQTVSKYGKEYMSALGKVGASKRNKNENEKRRAGVRGPIRRRGEV